MGCQWIKLADGTSVHIRFSGGKNRQKQCRFCRRGFISKLCDFPVGHGKTCDAGFCDACAATVSPNVDYCPIHKGQVPPNA